VVHGEQILGTVQYSAPEYFVGEPGTACSDIFSLGVITYQMLTRKLPFGAQVSKARSKSKQRKLHYRSANQVNPKIPEWLDQTLKKAVHPDPQKRYEVLSQLTFDLRHPNKNFLQSTHVPLSERNPLVFWQAISLVLAGLVVFLLALGR